MKDLVGAEISGRERRFKSQLIWSFVLSVAGMIIIVSWTKKVDTELLVSDMELRWSHSKIIQDDREAQNTLAEYLSDVQDPRTPWELCFRASEHQYSAYAFHAYCDHKGPTVTLVRVGENAFGGYADKSWDGDAGHFTHSTAAFLFRLKSPTSTRSYKLPAYRNQNHALYSNRGHGPTFGGGLDMRLDDRCNINTSLGVTTSYSNLGFTYQLPADIAAGTALARKLLAGAYVFRCDDYEVFFQR